MSFAVSRHLHAESFRLEVGLPGKRERPTPETPLSTPLPGSRNSGNKPGTPFLRPRAMRSEGVRLAETGTDALSHREQEVSRMKEMARTPAPDTAPHYNSRERDRERAFACYSWPGHEHQQHQSEIRSCTRSLRTHGGDFF